MENNRLFQLLQSTGIPTAHNVFLKAQRTPYLLYRDDETDIIAANSKKKKKKRKITLELYAAATAIGHAETAVEAVLDTFTTYSKARAFDDARQLYVTYYQFYLI